MQRLWRALARSRPRPGQAGEELACSHLRHEGFEIVERNYRCRSGELDVVARDGDVTVFVEVKQRRDSSYGEGYEAVTFGKRRRVVRAARLYAASHDLEEQPMRFDVVSVDVDGQGDVRIRHDRGAFDADAR